MSNKFNNEQRAAIEFGCGAMLLLAGPGSGKTTVITHRIKTLIDNGVLPEDILVITFTKAAAVEMKERFLNISESSHSFLVNFGTFHSIFYNILKSHRTFRNVLPINDKEKISLLRRAIEIARLEKQISDFDAMTNMLSLISACKNNVNNPVDFEQINLKREEFTLLFNAYNSLLRDSEKIDFDDMVNVCLDTLKSDEEYLRYYQKKFKYILIDEFQDISSNQYELVKLLAAPEMNVFAVGDDDQAIYGFRGSDVSLMNKFLNDFLDSKKNYLNINYRSTRNIVDFSKKIISNNENRFEKNITAAKDFGKQVEIIEHNSLQDEQEYIKSIIKKRIKEGVDINNIAILTRTNRNGIQYSAFLNKYNIPVVNSRDNNVFGSEHIKDICAYLFLSHNEYSREAFLRIMNKPVRYIKRDAVNSDVDLNYLKSFYRNDNKMLFRINDLIYHLNRLKNMSYYLSVKYIRNTIGYNKYLKDKLSYEKYMECKEELDAFESLVKNVEITENIYEYIDSIKKETDNKSGVRMMTFHGSKGLEYDTVIIPDLNENVVPSKSAKTLNEIEEERRMFYVAITRAKTELYILYRTDDGKRKSRFI